MCQPLNNLCGNLHIVIYLHVPKTAEDGDETAVHRSFVSLSLQTGLCDWSAKYFAQPVMKVGGAGIKGHI